MDHARVIPECWFPVQINADICRYMQIYADILLRYIGQDSMILIWSCAFDFNCFEHLYWQETGGSSDWDWQINWTNSFMTPGESVNIEDSIFLNFTFIQRMPNYDCHGLDIYFYMTNFKTIMELTFSLIGSDKWDFAAWLVMENLIHRRGKVFLKCFMSTA